jgi:hypothetical protein
MVKFSVAPDTDVTVTVSPNVLPAAETSVHLSVFPTVPSSGPGHTTLLGDCPTVFASWAEIRLSSSALERLGVPVDAENEHAPNSPVRTTAHAAAFTLIIRPPGHVHVAESRREHRMPCIRGRVSHDDILRTCMPPASSARSVASVILRSREVLGRDKPGLPSGVLVV